MKKLVITLSLVLALAIAAAVSLPVLAASEDVGTTTVSVTIEGTVDISTPPATTTMTPPASIPGDATAAVPITVGGNVAGWKLLLVDKRTAPAKGYMFSGTTPLQSPLSAKGGDQATLTPLTSDIELESSGATGAPATITVDFNQPIVFADPPGVYSIVVTFVGVLP